jgi:hypothetical protein
MVSVNGKVTAESLAIRTLLAEEATMPGEAVGLAKAFDKSEIWLDSDPILDRYPNSLLATQISLGRLNRYMPQ